MEYRQLGSSGLKVSVVGLGTNNFGFRMDEESSIKVAHKALEEGINFIDTADSYGRGLSEERIGMAFKDTRKDVIIATKVANPVGDGPNMRGNSRHHIMNQVEASLRFLQTDYIDLYQIHRVDPNTPIEGDHARAGRPCAPGQGALHRLLQLRRMADVRGNLDLQGHNLAPFVTVQPEYNMLNRSVERELAPFCDEYNIGILPFYPLASGFLTGKYRQGEPVPEGTRLAGNQRAQGNTLTEKNFAHAVQAGELCRRAGTSNGGAGYSLASGQPRGELGNLRGNQNGAGDGQRQGRRLAPHRGRHEGDRRDPAQRRLRPPLPVLFSSG